MKSILKALIRIRSDSGSDMSEIIRAAQAFLAKDDIGIRVYWEDSKTPCLVARYSRRRSVGFECGTLGLHCHLDTFSVEDSGWRVDPLAAEEIKGRVFGRGALDCKGLAAVWIELLLEFSEALEIFPFDVLLIMSSDEETGGESVKKLLTDTAELKDCFLVIGEGGGFPIRSGKLTFFTVQTGEMAKYEYAEVLESTASYLNLFEIIHGMIGKIITTDTLLFTMRNKLGMRDPLRSLAINPLFGEVTVDRFRHRSPLAKSKRLNNARHKLLLETEMSSPKGSSLGLNAIKNALRSAHKKYRILPLVTLGFSDNRHFRNFNIPVLGFFPLDSKNAISGFHGANEYLSLESMSSAEIILKSAVMNIKEAIGG